MQFFNSATPLTEEEIAQIEVELGVKLPVPLRTSYLRTNGGEPDPYVFENDQLDTVVSAFLPLKSTGTGDAVRTYANLVLNKRIVPAHFFPFAIDGGGDYFFCDLHTSSGDVYFYESDSVADDPMLPLSVGITEFWGALKPESD